MARDIHLFTRDLPIEKVWGIGPQTSAYLAKCGIRTALDFAGRTEQWVRQHLTKPYFEIWQELNGNSVLPVETQEKSTYASIQKVKTFTPPSNDLAFVLAQLSKNIENACMKARRYNLAAKGAILFVKTQDFRASGVEIKFSRRSAIPNEIIKAAALPFKRLLEPGQQYRATGVVLLGLECDDMLQLDLFREGLRVEKLKKLYASVDKIRNRYGKHTLYLGSSFLANQFAQHLGERGDVPVRRESLLKGETPRRRLGIPMFLGLVD